MRGSQRLINHNCFTSVNDIFRKKPFCVGGKGS
jgi:hypothetical protein